MKIHSKLNKFRIKKLDCFDVSDFRILLEIQAILLKTSSNGCAEQLLGKKRFDNIKFSKTLTVHVILVCNFL
jgi:hypothetical protein